MPSISGAHIASHAVPKRLLRAFSYHDVKTNSPRLWRYEKGRKPYWKASPDKATAVEGHFADPADASIEREIEQRLACEIEDPVNQFIDDMSDPLFVPTDEQRRRLTRYVTLLLVRSEARRAASSHDVGIRRASINMFLATEQQILTVAAHWNIQIVLSGGTPDPLMTRKDVIDVAKHHLKNKSSAVSAQQSYVRTMTEALTGFNDAMCHGSWSLIATKADNPFILGDNPVVTWARLFFGKLNYGEGYSRPDVEILLPISPLTCWHILPKVPRSRRILNPTVNEINVAEAKFARRACFANVQHPGIDKIVQEHISTIRLGQNAGTAWHQLERHPFYDFMMSIV